MLRPVRPAYDLAPRIFLGARIDPGPRIDLVRLVRVARAEVPVLTFSFVFTAFFAVFTTPPRSVPWALAGIVRAINTAIR